MASDEKQLVEYKLQLQQVEAALTVDEDNEELLKLKKDLEEVIDLTQVLIAQQALAADIEENEPEGGTSQASSSSPALYTEQVQYPEHSWDVGDSCMALYSKDQQYYEATIDEILDDGSCSVTFSSYGNTDVTQVALLKPVEGDEKRSGDQQDGGPSAKKAMTKKDQLLAQREYKRKKNQKKAQRQKQLEEERETEKNKWLDFNSKTFSKTNKGRVKRSIFATPESVSGRVGIGTCGIGGRPMTGYKSQEKWKK